MTVNFIKYFIFQKLNVYPLYKTGSDGWPVLRDDGHYEHLVLLILEDVISMHGSVSL